MEKYSDDDDVDTRNMQKEWAGVGLYGMMYETTKGRGVKERTLAYIKERVMERTLILKRQRGARDLDIDEKSVS